MLDDQGRKSARSTGTGAEQPWRRCSGRENTLSGDTEGPRYGAGAFQEHTSQCIRDAPRYINKNCLPTESEGSKHGKTNTWVTSLLRVLFFVFKCLIMSRPYS